MKKLFLLPIFLLCLCLCGCQSDNTDNYSDDLRLNIKHIDEKDAEKVIHISYPVFGGLDDKESVTIVNTSIKNYVDSEYEEFHNALISTDTTVLGNTETDVSDYSEDDYDEESYDEESYDEESEDDSENAEKSKDSKKSKEKKERLTLNVSFKITYNKNNYLCVVQTYEKNLGNDLKFNGQRSFFFSLTNATYLTLGELFDFDNGFSAYVNERINNDLAAGAYTTYAEDSGFKGISKNCKFYIDSSHLYIYYDALELSPDKDAVPTFAFDLKDIKQYFNDDYANIY